MRQTCIRRVRLSTAFHTNTQRSNRAAGTEESRVHHTPIQGGGRNFKNGKTAEQNNIKTYTAARLVVIAKTARLPVPPAKQPLDTFSQSYIIYKYVCSCGEHKYVGKSTRSLGKRASEHIPQWLLKGNINGRTGASSAITQHLVQARCTPSRANFSIIARAKNAAQLSTLEAVAIKIHKPTLCKQKEFIQSLYLPWG